MLSRVANSLYWMSRYLERAEHTARLVDVHLNLMLEEATPLRADQRWQRLQKALRIPEAIPFDDPYELAATLTFDVNNGSSVAAAVYTARENARQVRDLVTTEMWQELNRMYLFVKESRSNGRLGAQPHDFFQGIKSRVQMFQGVTDSTMSHNEGWHFIQLGRSIERAGAVSTLLDVHFGAFEKYDNTVLTLDEYFEWLGLLKSCTAFEPYTKTYSAELRPDCIAEFLLLNEDFPHSVRFCGDRLQDALTAIAHTTGTTLGGRVHRLAGRLRASLNYDQITEIMSGGLHNYLHEIQRQCDTIHTAAYETYIDYPIEKAFNV